MLGSRTNRGGAGRAPLTAPAFEPFTKALKDEPPATFVSMPREPAVCLIALLFAAETAPTRRLEYAEHFAQLASEAAVIPDAYVQTYWTVAAAVERLEAVADQIPADRLARLRWKVVELAARSGLPVETAQAFGAARRHGAVVPPAVINAMSGWRLGSAEVAASLLTIVSNETGETWGPVRSALAAARAERTEVADATR